MHTTQLGVVSDIYDGKLYQKLAKDGKLLNPHNISLLCNTDGVCVYESTTHTMWPILLMVNELPYNLRYVQYCILHVIYSLQ